MTKNFENYIQGTFIKIQEFNLIKAQNITILKFPGFMAEKWKFWDFWEFSLAIPLDNIGQMYDKEDDEQNR